MTKKQELAVSKVPDFVELECLDGTFAHVVCRVEHVVSLRDEGEDFYTKSEAESCRKWLAKYADMVDEN